MLDPLLTCSFTSDTTARTDRDRHPQTLIGQPRRCFASRGSWVRVPSAPLRNRRSAGVHVASPRLVIADVASLDVALPGYVGGARSGRPPVRSRRVAQGGSSRHNPPRCGPRSPAFLDSPGIADHVVVQRRPGPLRLERRRPLEQLDQRGDSAGRAIEQSEQRIEGLVIEHDLGPVSERG